MSDNEESLTDMEKLFKEVCLLTSDNCGDAFEEFKEHGNRLKLVVDVFKAIDKCDTEKCQANKDEIYHKLNEFLREHNRGKIKED